MGHDTHRGILQSIVQHIRVRARWRGIAILKFVQNHQHHASIPRWLDDYIHDGHRDYVPDDHLF